MSYSVFKHTMADMDWTSIEESIKDDAVVLLPSGVIEQQGPHLPTATELYVSYKICLLVKSELGCKACFSHRHAWRP